MSAEFIKMYAQNPDPRRILQIVDALRDGALIIYPTDTVYGLGCDIFHSKAIERVRQIKGLKGKNLDLSFICSDLSNLSEYAKHVDNQVFKIMKRALPGPFTFILEASSKTPKILHTKKKTVGIRVPDNNIPREIVRVLGNPIITTSIHDDDTIIDYATDPELIYDEFKNKVDIIIDGGPGLVTPSTVINCSGGEIEIVREGLGDISLIL